MDLNARNEKVCLELANLFFLDTETDEKDFARVADLLKQTGWSRSQTEDVLIRLIAPNAGINLGYLLWPSIGEWAGFDESWLCDKVRHSIALRAQRPQWHFLISDWWCKRMLHQLGIDRLLNRL
jgi:hypothetical protein